ncbi:protein of unknown function [Candidatus Methylocalor cossyra]|uniref:Uncharacterized protein n=1 Tax=Candidatus Methylocalor cossyra TaxID=3108543 RepID=A0ABP1CCK2_9GAMM
MVLGGAAAGYPGHNCPGLIEALYVVYILLLMAIVIRGITAPASLKHIADILLHLPDIGLSGA